MKSRKAARRHEEATYRVVVGSLNVQRNAFYVMRNSFRISEAAPDSAFAKTQACWVLIKVRRQHRGIGRLNKDPPGSDRHI